MKCIQLKLILFHFVYIRVLFFYFCTDIKSTIVSWNILLLIEKYASGDKENSSGDVNSSNTMENALRLTYKGNVSRT